MSNDVRKHPLAECETCPIREIGQYVPSYGPEKAELAFVGEAPGANEARQGVPFIGVSGQLLNATLRHHGIDRNKVFLTNACLCRPTDNSTPPPAAVRACNPRLLKELQGREPKTVVALGNTAAKALINTNTGITQLRIGPGRESDKLPGVKIIPTFHPAAALRSADLFPYIVSDLHKIGGGTRSGDAFRAPEWRVADDPTDALRVIEALRGRGGPIVIDIEVGIEKDTAFDHPDQYDYLCVGFSYRRGGAVVVGERALADPAVRSALRDLLSDPGIRWIAQNGKFDLAGMYRIGKAKLWFDTMLASYCLDERPGVHSLEYLGVERLGAPNWKREVDKYVNKGESYAVIPRDVLYRYNAYDCATTYMLYEDLAEELDKKGLRELHDFLIQASNELMFLEMNGVTIDIEYLDKLTDTYLDRLGDIEGQLNSVLWKHDGPIKSCNPRSPKQVKEVLQMFFLKLRQTERAPATLPTMIESTDVDHLKAYAEFLEPDSPEYDWIDTLLKHRREAKLYGTYVKGIRKRLYRGRVYPTFLLHGTTTGRLACRNPNLQNIPRESSIRRLFVPAKPENVFIQADYAQAELRVMAILANDQYLIDIFNDPTRDLFDELTPILYPGKIKENTDPVAWKELRIRVKAYVYGLSYGREEFSIAQEFKIPVAEAKRGMRAFFEVIPGIVAWREENKNQILTQQQLVTPFGRRRRFWLITKENVRDVLKEGLAFKPQSTASDLCLSSLVELRPRLVGRAFIRIPVHDSILAEADQERATEVAGEMREVMMAKPRELFGDVVPFKVDISIGRSWGDLHEEVAQPV